MEVTVFKNISDVESPFYLDIQEVFERIRDGNSKDLVNKIRKEKYKKIRNQLKKSLNSICFSGIFPRRYDDAIIHHSGLICLDFDGFSDFDAMDDFKRWLMSDPYTMSVFISPSGEGLKVVVKIPEDEEKHKAFFAGLEQYYSNPHFDSSTSNLSRVCYESYDPNIYVNMDSEVWDKEFYIRPADSKPAYTPPQGEEVTDEDKIIAGLEKWWSVKYPIVEGHRNINCFVIACAMCEYGVSKDRAMGYLQDFQDGDFTFNEIETTVNSAYKTSQFASKKFSDFSKNMRGYGLVGGEADPVTEDEDSSNEDRMSMADIRKFWVITDKGAIDLNPMRLRKFLTSNGFYTFRPVGGKDSIFIRIENNMISHVDEEKIKTFVLNSIENNERVYNYFTKRVNYFTKSFLNFLDEKEVTFKKDSKYESRLYFKNKVVVVSRKEVKTISYLDMDSYIWKDQIISREFVKRDDHDCDFKKFISNVCGGDALRIRSMESTLGYLVHTFRDPSYSPAVIFNDEVISNKPQGGSGKGLIMQAVGQLRRLVTINGKDFKAGHTFQFQTVTEDTQVMLFDDVRKGFNFEDLFSTITEGITIEKKNMSAIKKSFHDSPKIAITTNYPIKGSGNSHDRRKWDVQLKKFYTKKFTPYHEFGKSMFIDWDLEEWSKFDNYMVHCTQLFLNHGLCDYAYENSKVRDISTETCQEFAEYCGLFDSDSTTSLFDKFANGHKCYKGDLYDDFVKEYPDFGQRGKKSISRIAFTSWLKSYCDIVEGVTPLEGRDSQRWIKLRERHELEETGDIPF